MNSFFLASRLGNSTYAFLVSGTRDRLQSKYRSRTYVVQLCDAEGYDLFFLPLILPTLQSLVTYKYGLPCSYKMYSSLLVRSGCKIEELHFGTFDAESHNLLALLQSTLSV